MNSSHASATAPTALLERPAFPSVRNVRPAFRPAIPARRTHIRTSAPVAFGAYPHRRARHAEDVVNLLIVFGAVVAACAAPFLG